MPKRALGTALIVLSVLLIALSLPGCDLIQNIIGGGDEGPDPIEIPASVDADPAFATLESDFFDAINLERTDNAAIAFTATTASVNALARRYASAGQCDTSGTNLEDRIGTAMGGCSDAAYFLFKGTSVAVSTAMATWLSQSGGTAAMTNSEFTKIGIGMAETAAVGGAPGESWVCVVVLLAKP